MALYAGAAPFWWVALRKVRDEMHTRTIPLLSLFAAFSFVTMMFNLPLPGGTTGHAVGMGIASIVLGPWVSMLAISIALLIQALLFGDGGITTFGANCFNMAIVGSLTAYGGYRLISRGAPILSVRRVAAAGLAGYTAINLAALCAAIEFGVQPLFFRDPSGAPLYAPYPLSVAIPAMMIGHLTFAGFAELILTAGLVQYLQRADPAMLQRTAPGAVTGAPLRETQPKRKTVRLLWAALALVVCLTPLGILAVGSAWGEWRANDFSDPAARQQIAAASGHLPPPVRAPQGLERLSTFWRAPISNYAPSFMAHASAGYLVSAAVGTGLILLCSFLTIRLLSPTTERPDLPADEGVARAARWQRKNFIEGTLRGVFRAMDEALLAEEIARATGFLQGLDARVKLAGIGGLLVAVIAVERMWVLGAVFVISALLAVVSHVPWRMLARIWLAVLGFTGLIALPALFLVTGQEVLRVPFLGWVVTWQGLRSAVFLILRAETAATLSLLLILTTPWNHLLRSLRFFRLPVVFVAIIETTYRFVFVLLQTAGNMFESRRARSVGRLAPAEQRRLASATVAVLLEKSLALSHEVQTAMQARGFRGEAVLLEDPKMTATDWLPLAAFLVLSCFAIWLGR